MILGGCGCFAEHPIEALGGNIALQMIEFAAMMAQIYSTCVS
jgi:hypothetical protein